MKEKIKNHIKKHKIIYSALLILFCFSGLILSFNKIELTDELFTFANTYKLHNGISLYSENNVIDTPLFFYIGNIFLSVLGANFFAYKIYGIFIFEVIFLISLNILRKLKVPTGRAVVYILLILLPFTKTLFVNGANYSTLALLFWLLGMNLVIKKDKFEVKPIQQGIISALVFATKQNIGVYYLIAITLFTIYNYRKEIKTILKKLVSTYIIFVLITAIWCIILILQGQFIDFINYCVLGIGEFAQNHFDFQDWRIILYAIPVFALVGLIIANKKYGISLENKPMKATIFFLCFMFPSLLIGYPIFNAYHIELAMVVSMVYCMYMAEQVIIYTKEIFLVKPVKIVIIGYIVFVLLINAFYIGSTIIKGAYKTDYNNPYFGMLATEEMKNKINEIVNFVELKEEKNQKVIIFSEEANIYQIVLGKNYQDLDLPLLGNWGYNGEERVLNKIMNLKDSFILIKDTSRTNQESEKIKQYIKNNYNRTGEIQGFEIYYIE
ncbi:unknown [Clostridium sp. CAG:354]|jgi:hypothetical protein|nr:hypothetical protein [Clostridium sp.]MEE0268232.1 hypothetical protein [Clostridia bacterium]CDE10407.1 unknown [Clostridium sp. CAG:354]